MEFPGTSTTEEFGTRPPSGPDLLITILSEYVAPHAGGAWQEQLVAALELTGRSTAAARQTTARAVKVGALIAHKVGRRSWMQISDDAARILRERPALLSDHPPQSAGPWDVFIMRNTSDTEGATRYRQRTNLLLAGLGSLGAGVWIAPSHAGSVMLQRALADEPNLSLIVLRSEIVYPDARTLVESAWDLDEIGGLYRRLVEDFSSAEAVSDQDCFIAWTELQRRWRDCVRRDPGLPPGSLPSPWPRQEAEDLLAVRDEQWSRAAARAFNALGAHLPPPPAL